LRTRPTAKSPMPTIIKVCTVETPIPSSIAPAERSDERRLTRATEESE
jgi:hypothetical protein